MGSYNIKNIQPGNKTGCFVNNVSDLGRWIDDTNYWFSCWSFFSRRIILQTGCK